jgi:hypothetical protein
LLELRKRFSLKRREEKRREEKRREEKRREYFIWILLSEQILLLFVQG